MARHFFPVDKKKYMGANGMYMGACTFRISPLSLLAQAKWTIIAQPTYHPHSRLATTIVDNSLYDDINDSLW